jgi:hypothetical protein
VEEVPAGTAEGRADPGGEAVSGPTIDEKIGAVKRYLRMLKEDRKKLNKQIIENRQDQASARNMLKKLQEAKEAKQ